MLIRKRFLKQIRRFFDLVNEWKENKQPQFCGMHKSFYEFKSKYEGDNLELTVVAL